MSNGNAPTAERQQGDAANLPSIGQPRLPYHPLVEERFGIDRASWKALVEAIYPAAQRAESVILALSYCRARKLDPFKRNVHIVPIWDKERQCLVDTVWPGIGELRTTAFRTGQYAGRDRTEFGPDKTETWRDGSGNEISVTFPEWAQVTVYRMKDGQRVAFAGPQVYWLETFAEQKGGVPNAMWRKRPRGQIDKCAEAAALRAAFPEELGDEFSEAEAGMVYQHGKNAQSGVTLEHQPVPAEEHDGKSKLDRFATQATATVEDAPQTLTQSAEAPEDTDSPGATADAPQAAEGGGAQQQDAGVSIVDPATGEVVATYKQAKRFFEALQKKIAGSSNPREWLEINRAAINHWNDEAWAAQMESDVGEREEYLAHHGAGSGRPEGGLV